MSVEFLPCGSAQTKTFLGKILTAKDPYIYNFIIFMKQIEISA